MSSYGGRRGPNVSQYLRDLNNVKDTPPAVEEPFNLEDDLTIFTNTQFFDFDSGQKTDFQAQPAKPDAAETTAPSSAATEDINSTMGELTSLDFLSGEFNFPDFTNTYPSSSVSTFPEGLGSLQPLQPNPPPVYASGVPQQQNGYGQPGSRGSDSRQPDSPSRSMNFEDQSRHAAEEDKRRRNTAASARFRIKKKQREQALEKSAKEMTDKVTALENRITLLETENRWLKNLVMEKNGSNEDIATMFKEFNNSNKQAGEVNGGATKGSSDALKNEK